MALRIWLARDDGRAPGDLYDSLLAMLRDNQLSGAIGVRIPDAAADDPEHGRSIRVLFVTASAGTAFARALFGWLNVWARTPARLVLARSDGQRLVLPGADWAVGQTALALAEFIEAEAHASNPSGPGNRPDGTTDGTTDSSETVRPNDWYADTAAPPVQGNRVSRSNLGHAPESTEGASPVHNTPPGPPFGDEDDDEW